MKLKFDAMGRPMAEGSITTEGLNARGGFSDGARRFVPKKCPR